MVDARTINVSAAKIIGQSLPRPNAMSFIEGRGRYLDDITLHGMLHVVFVRSPYAHARIVGINIDASLAVEGVHKVLTGKDIAPHCKPWTAILTNMGEMRSTPQAAMPVEVARWQGEPVAAVIADSRAIAEDAAELVDIEWQELPAVTSIESAADDTATIIHDELGTNVAWSLHIDAGEVDDALENCDVVVERTFEVGRQTGVTLEPRGIIASFDSAVGAMTIYQSTQVPHIHRNVFAKQLGLAESDVRIICPDLGGGFGLKLHTYADEIATAAISKIIPRPIKFCADRLEAFVSDIHARGHRVKAKIGVNNDGDIQVMTVDDLAGCGPYLIHPRTSVIEPLLVAICVPLAYDMPNYRADATLVYQNKVPTGQYRGVGMPVASLVAEGLVDAAANALGMDKAEIRRRNLVKDDAYPCTSVSGEYLECLSQQAALEKLLEMMDYDALVAEAHQLREQGTYRGVGLSCVVEGTAPSPALYAAGGAPISSRDACTLRLEADGGISCATGLTDQGQGGIAVITQVLAETIGVGVDTIKVFMGDTATTPFGGGTWASRGTAIAGEAALQAGKAIRDVILDTAAAMTDRARENLYIVDAVVMDAETKERVAGLDEIGETVHFKTHTLPKGFEPELVVTRHYSQRNQMLVYANCSLGVSLDVDVNTGLVKLNKVWAVDDCGRIINEKLVAEQMRGGVVQGIGSTLYEECIYDDNGQLLNGNLMEYLVPMAGEMPDIICEHIETPTKETELGAKGCGEAGVIAISAAIMNAINDALTPFDVSVTTQPFTPARILEALGKI
jgi:carbon-monoxide dehydrogenase large subunit